MSSRIEPRRTPTLRATHHERKRCRSQNKHAHMLLKADEDEQGPSWTDARIAEFFWTSETTVRSLQKRLVEKGFEAALEQEKQLNFRNKLRRN